MKKTLYISDLDGTLLQPDSTLTDFARNNLNEMIDEGLLFTVATGRQLFSVQDVLRGLNLRLPVVEKDGAFVSDLHTGEHFLRRDIVKETAVGILDMILTAGHYPFINTYDGSRDKLCYQEIGNDGASWYLERREFFKDPRLTYADLVQTVTAEHTVGFIVIGPEAELTPLFEQLMSRYPGELSGYVQANHYSPGWHWLVVHHEESQKDRGIRAVQEMAGLLDAELVAFGDQLNDLPMIHSADRGYAMGNGETAVQQIADATIGPNTADSVVRFIMEEWRGDKA